MWENKGEALGRRKMNSVIIKEVEFSNNMLLGERDFSLLLGDIEEGGAMQLHHVGSLVF